MMKKASVILIAVMLLMLCACGAEEPQPSEEPEIEAAYDKLYFASGDVKFGIFDDADSVISALGEPQGTFEADSCAYQGKDYFYYYDGFELTANDVDGKMLITGIRVSDDTVKTPQGIYIGMAVDEALELLDCEYEQSGEVYRVSEGSTVLLLNVGDDGTLSAIEYLPA